MIGVKDNENNFIYFYTREVFNFLNFGYFDSFKIYYLIEKTYLNINIIDFVFYFIILFSALIYKISKYKEVRLIKMLLLVIIGLNLSGFIVFLFYNILHLSEFGYWKLFLFVKYIIILFFLIKIFNNIQTKNDSDFINENQKIDTSKIQRFWHFIFDNIFSILILSKMIYYLKELIFVPIEKSLGFSIAILTILFILKFVYNLMFELLFFTTPGKVLTESKIVDLNGENPTLLQILHRNIIKLIFIEPFLYLGNAKMLRDEFSKTKIVCKKSNGIKGRVYLFVLALIIALSMMSIVVKNIYKEYSEKNDCKKYITEILQNNEKLINGIDTNSVILVNENYKYLNLYLKVEEIDKELFICSYFIIEPNENYPIIEIWKYYQKNKHKFSKKIINKKVFDVLFNQNVDSTFSVDPYINLFQDETKYKLIDIKKFYQPSIELLMSNIEENKISISIINHGWSSSLISVESAEGTVSVENKLPIRIETYSNIENNQYNLLFIFEEVENFKFKLCFLNDNKRFYYVLEKNKNSSIQLKKME